MNENTKICSKCGRELPLNEFRKSKRSKDGHQGRCRYCCMEHDRKYRRDREINKKNKLIKEEVRKETKECIACHKELPLEAFSKNRYTKDKLHYYCKECAKNKRKLYREENKERINKHNKDYYENNKEYLKEYYKEYYKKNKGKITEYNKKYFQTSKGRIVQFNAYNRRRAKEQAQGSGLTKEQWLEMMKFFNWHCAYSGITLTKDTRSIDHVVALNKNGEHEVWNLVPMYRPYNSSKHDKDMLKWYKQQDFYSEERLAKIYEWQEYALNKWGAD